MPLSRAKTKQIKIFSLIQQYLVSAYLVLKATYLRLFLRDDFSHHLAKNRQTLVYICMPLSVCMIMGIWVCECVCFFTYTYMSDREDGYNSHVNYSSCFVKISSCCWLRTWNTSTAPEGANIPLSVSDTSLNS